MIAQSGNTKVSLLELFSSEGCSSCPRAWEWLNNQKNSAGLWKDFVPVDFHVDYWNHLGWKDPFAENNFSSRQRAYSASWGGGGVYTPGFVLDGKEWSHWYLHKTVKAKKEAAGNLLGEHAGEDRYKLVFEPVDKSTYEGKFTGYFALLGFGIYSSVKSGENRGRDFEHNFTVLDFKSIVLKRQGDGRYEGVVPLQFPKGVKIKKKALAAWVTVLGDDLPLQAAGANF